MTSEKVFFNNNKGQKLCGIFEIPDKNSKEIIIFFHGNGSSKDAQTSNEFREQLQEAGKNAFRFDFNGCGESEGDYTHQTVTSTIEDAEAALNLCKDMGFTEIYLQGQSHGGLVANEIALRHRDIKKLGLYAPVVDYPRLWDRSMSKEFFESMKPGECWTRTSDTGRKKTQCIEFYHDSRKYILKDNPSNILVPTLIVTGTRDKKVLPQDIEEVKHKYDHLIYKVIEGADHQGIKDGNRDELNKIMFDWFMK